MPQKEYARRQISSVPVDKFKSHGLDWSEPLSKPLFKQENPGPMCTQEGNTLKCYPRGTFAHPIFKEVWLSDCAYSFSHVWLFATPWTRVCQPSLPMGILQARILEWIAMPSSRRYSQDKDTTQVSNIASEFFTIWATMEALKSITEKWYYSLNYDCKFIYFYTNSVRF